VSQSTPTDQATRPDRAELTRQLDGVVAAHLRDQPGLTVSCQAADADAVIAERGASRQHYAASTMKLPLVLAAYRRHDEGTLDLDSTVEIHNSFRSRSGGTFGLDRQDDSDDEVWDQLGRQVSLRWLCRRAVVRSSNLATNLVLAEVGFDAVAEAVSACGADGVQVVRGIGDFGAQRDGSSNQVTTAGLNRILLALAAGRAARPDTCTELLEVLAANEVATDIRPALPAGTWVAHKNGWVSDVVLDAALIRPRGGASPAGEFALTVAVSGAWPNERSHALIQDVAATVWRAVTGG
jgi:beta-lactamase class A